MNEPSRNSNNRPTKWEKDHSSMHGFLITLRLRENVVSPSISPSGNSKLTFTTVPLLMPQDTEISSKT